MRKLLLTLLLLAGVLHAENIYATFNVAAQKSANLAFTASGLVSEVNVTIGSLVKKDEVLAKLASEDIQAMVQKRKIALKFAKRALDRQEKIKKLIDASKYDVVVSSYENAKASLAYEEALYDKTVLKAPFEGIIYDKSIEVGDAVSGMMLKTVFKIQSLHKRKLILAFDQKYHNVVKVGDTFKYHIDGDTKQYEGKISKIYPYANVNNRKMNAEVEAEDFMVGLFGDGSIIIDGK